MKEEESPAYKRICDWDLKGFLYSSPLKMKCLLCSRILFNPGSDECQVFRGGKRDRKPDDIYFRNAACPHFERCADEQGLYWIDGYVELSREAYIPRQDDIPPAGWERVNEKYCGENWKSKI